MDDSAVNELMVHGILVGVFQENCWIIGSKQAREAICIDPGDEADTILDVARDMGVSIKLIANTHAHLDHIMGVRGVKNATNSAFLLHPNDLEMARNGWQQGARMFGLNYEEGPPEPNGLLSDGDVVSVDGLDLRVLHTPGHTQGSVCYYVNGLLFSGDTLFRSSIGRTDLPGGDYRQEMASIVDILLKLPDETIVLPGHMNETTIAEERRTNPFILEEMEYRRLRSS
jgi:hydroxyacylglutathione hydrolase